MISVFPSTAQTTEELAGLGYPILDRLCKSAVLYATLNGEQYIKLVIPHRAESVKKDILPKGREILKIIDMDDEEDYYRVRKPKYNLSSTTIIAEHISSDLIDNLIDDINIVGLSGQAAMDKIQKSTQYKHPFEFRTNITSTANLRLVRTNPLQALIGTNDNTFVKRFGGELRRRRFMMTVNDRIGVERTGTIRSKKDLTGFESEVDWNAVATRIMPKGPNGILLPEKYIDSPYINRYEHPIIKVINYDVDYEGDFKNLSAVEQGNIYNKIRSAVKNDFENGIDSPPATYKITFANLKNTEEYKDYRALENYSLGDIIEVYEESHDVFITVKIVHIEWDILTGRYISMTLSNIKESFLKGGINRSAELSSRVNESESTATKALAAADGKTTNYYGYEEPRNPQKGDLWYKRNGDEDEMWQWQEVNGRFQWVYLVGTAQSNQIKKDFEAKVQAVNDTLEKTANKANEALEKAGGIIDSQELLNKINSQIKADAFNEDGEGAGRRFKAQKQNIQRTIDRIINLKSETTLYQQTNDAAITRLTQSLENTVTKAEMKQTADGIRETIAEVQTKGSGGPNMIRNSRADEGLKYWTEANNRLGFTSHPFYLNGQKRMFELRPAAIVKSPRFIVKRSTDYMLNVLGFDNNSKYFRIYFCKRKKGSTADFDEKQLVFDGKPRWVDGAVFDNGRTVKKTFKFNVGDFDDGYLQLEYDKNNPNKWGGLFVTEIDFYEGTNERLWQPAPEDGAEWVDSRVTTLDRTLDGIKATVTQVKNYADADGQRKQELTQLVRDETAKGVTTLLTKVEEAGYVKRTEVQSVLETQKLYDRLIGTTEENVKQNIARMTMTDSLFQTEISKLVNKELDVTNYVIDPYEISNYRLDSYTAIKQVAVEAVSGSVYNKLTFVVDTQGNRNIYIPMYSLSETTQQFSFAIKIETAGGLQVRNIYYRSNNNGAYTLSKSVNGDVYTGSLPILGKNSKINPELQIEFTGTGTAKVSKPIVIEGTEAKTEYEPTKIERLLTQSEKAGQAVKTIQTQLAGSWAVKNLNSAGDIVGQVNLTDGDFRFVGKRFHITGETLIDNAAIKSAAIENVSADKITAGTIDANRVNLINLNANSITSGTISGIDIKGSIFKGQNDEFVIDSKNNSLLFSQNTFLGFENNKYSQYSVFSDGSRIVNGSGSGLVIAAGVDKSDFDYLKNRPNNRDLYTILSGGKSAAYLAVGADNSRTRGVITATARTGLKFQVSKSGGAFLTIGDGSAVGENIGRALLHGDDVILSSSRNLQISCPNLKLLKNNKDLIEYHNALARLVKMIAERNGWTNVTDYSI